MTILYVTLPSPKGDGSVTLQGRLIMRFNLVAIKISALLCGRNLKSADRYMGQVIAIANQKGGTGKSSCAVHLLHWCSQKGSTLLIDADAQESSTRWVQGKDYNSRVEQDPEELFELAQDQADNYQFLIIDCPGSLGEVTKAAIYCADIVLIPVQPGVLDVDSANKTFRHIKHAQKIRKDGTPTGLAFISRAIKGTRALAEAKEYLQQQPHITLANSVIYQRQLIQDAPASRSTAFTMQGTIALEVANFYSSLFEEALSIYA